MTTMVTRKSSALTKSGTSKMDFNKMDVKVTISKILNSKMYCKFRKDCLSLIFLASDSKLKYAMISAAT